MEKAYLENIYDGIDLYFDFSFIDYEDVPIVFVCHDLDWNLYLCNCTEIRYRQEWTIAKTTLEIIQLLFDQELPVYEALKANGGIKYLASYEYRTNLFCTEKILFDDIPNSRLPEKSEPLKSINYESEDEFIKLKEKMNYYNKKNTEVINE